MNQEQAYHFILVEDSKLDAFIGEKIIQSFGAVCLSLRVFVDPQEALAYILEREFMDNRTILFLDIQMPLMTGFEFIESFEERAPVERQANFVINLLSSSINEKDMIRAGSFQSVHSFLNKPLRREMIQEVLDGLASAGKD